MGLDKSALQASFDSLFTMPTTNETSYTATYMAQQWADSYESYAATAADALGNSVSGMQKTAMQTRFQEAFEQYGSTVTTQQATSITIGKLTDGVNAYWTGVILEVSNLPPGGIVPITNVVNSTPNDISFEMGNTNNRSIGAERLAKALDDKTKAVTTLFSYIDGGGNPGTYNSTLC